MRDLGRLFGRPAEAFKVVSVFTRGGETTLRISFAADQDAVANEVGALARGRSEEAQPGSRALSLAVGPSQLRGNFDLDVASGANMFLATSRFFESRCPSCGAMGLTPSLGLALLLLLAWQLLA